MLVLQDYDRKRTINFYLNYLISFNSRQNNKNYAELIHDNFIKNYKNYIKIAHDINKQEFFENLNSDFIKNLQEG